MTTRTRIRIDRAVGLPLLLVLGLVARALGRLLRRDHSMQSSRVGTIVVAKFLGMGSILQSTPLLRSLRQRFPDARIVFLTSRRNRPMVTRLAEVDEVIAVDDRSVVSIAVTTGTALRHLVHLRVDLFVDLEVYAAYSALLAALSLARNRIGYYRYSARFRRGIYTHLIYFNARQPIRDIYLQLGLAAGADEPASTELSSPRVTPSDRDARLTTAPANEYPKGGYVVVNPNASDLLLERRWPAERFASVITRIARPGRRIILIGTEDERAHVATVIARLSPATRELVLDSSGQLELGALLALLADAACVITSDTGPMHMAVALGRPTVCLFGPCEPTHYGFSEPWVETLYTRVFCSPCVHEVDQPPCAGNNVCMQLIDVDSVVAATERLLDERIGRQEAHPSPRAPHWRRALDGQPLGLVVRGSLR